MRGEEGREGWGEDGWKEVERDGEGVEVGRYGEVDGGRRDGEGDREE